MTSFRTSLVLLMLFAAVPPMAAQDETPVVEKPRPRKTEVLRLEYAVADEMVPAVHQLLGEKDRRSVTLLADPRTNSIIVAGDDAAIATVQRAVALLDVAATHGKVAATRKPVAYEVVLFMLAPGAEGSLQLPRTSTGVIDPTEADAVLAKVRDAAGKGSVTEIVKLSLTADDGKPWKVRQAVQIPMTQTDRSGAQTFGGFQEAVMDFGVSPDNAKGTTRRLGISCRIERFASATESQPTNPSLIPPARLVNTLEFTVSADDGKLLMASVQSSASRADGNCLLFIRAKG